MCKRVILAGGQFTRRRAARIFRRVCNRPIPTKEISALRGYIDVKAPRVRFARKQTNICISPRKKDSVSSLEASNDRSFSLRLAHYRQSTRGGEWIPRVTSLTGTHGDPKRKLAISALSAYMAIEPEKLRQGPRAP